MNDSLQSSKTTGTALGLPHTACMAKRLPHPLIRGRIEGGVTLDQAACMGGALPFPALLSSFPGEMCVESLGTRLLYYTLCSTYDLQSRVQRLRGILQWASVSVHADTCVHSAKTSCAGTYKSSWAIIGVGRALMQEV